MKSSKLFLAASLIGLCLINFMGHATESTDPKNSLLAYLLLAAGFKAAHHYSKATEAVRNKQLAQEYKTQYKQEFNKKVINGLRTVPVENLSTKALSSMLPPELSDEISGWVAPEQRTFAEILPTHSDLLFPGYGVASYDNYAGKANISTRGTFKALTEPKKLQIRSAKEEALDNLCICEPYLEIASKKHHKKYTQAICAGSIAVGAMVAINTVPAEGIIAGSLAAGVATAGIMYKAKKKQYDETFNNSCFSLETKQYLLNQFWLHPLWRKKY